MVVAESTNHTPIGVDTVPLRVPDAFLRQPERRGSILLRTSNLSSMAGMEPCRSGKWGGGHVWVEARSP